MRGIDMNKSSVWQPSLTLMNQARIEQLHNAATKILEETGLNVHHLEMRRKLGDAGAKLGEDPRVYIPAEMVEQSLSTAKRQEEIVVHNRLGEPVMPVLAEKPHPLRNLLANSNNPKGLSLLNDVFSDGCVFSASTGS